MYITIIGNEKEAISLRIEGDMGDLREDSWQGLVGGKESNAVIFQLKYINF